MNERLIRRRPTVENASPVPLESWGEQSSLDEKGTIELLKNSGVQPLATWSPGKPVLYVFPDDLRKAGGPFSALPMEVRPVLARIDKPREIENFDLPPRQGKRVPCTLHNSPGGRVDYYSMDQTGAITFMSLPKDRRDLRNFDGYVVRPQNLYEVDDALFPPSRERQYDE